MEESQRFEWKQTLVPCSAMHIFLCVFSTPTRTLGNKIQFDLIILKIYEHLLLEFFLPTSWRCSGCKFYPMKNHLAIWKWRKSFQNDWWKIWLRIFIKCLITNHSILFSLCLQLICDYFALTTIFGKNHRAFE